MTATKWDNGRSETARRANVERPLTTSSDSTREGLAMQATRCSIPGCSKPAKKLGWCSMHYERQYKHGTFDAPHRPTLEERFMSHVQVDAAGCWRWQGWTATGGYAYFKQKIDGRWKSRRAHRVSYELFVGPIPDGLAIHHECEVRDCVNPDHLRATTWRENTLLNTSPAAENARRDTCRRGHPLSGDNVQIIKASSGERRRCKSCARARRSGNTNQQEEA